MKSTAPARAPSRPCCRPWPKGTSPSPGPIARLPQPFHVLATQNPLEQEGTYPLPEAQLDRFLLDIRIDYPAADG